MNFKSPLWLTLIVLTAPLLRSDDTRMVLAHPVAAYPGTVKYVTTDDRVVLTKDSLRAVEGFYRTRLRRGDQFHSLTTEDTQGQVVKYHEVMDGREYALMEVSFEAKRPTGNLHPALGELKAQAMMKPAREAEYKRLEKEYQCLETAFYRMVEDDSGRLVSEGERIYRAVYRKVHAPEKLKMSEDEKAEGKAKSQALKQQMQALKAKGDIAGMMKLAQESQASPRQTRVGGAAMDAAAQDTWDIWVACLRDLKAAAYWTKIHYHAPLASN